MSMCFTVQYPSPGCWCKNAPALLGLRDLSSCDSMLECEFTANIGRFLYLLRVWICLRVHFNFSHTLDERKVPGQDFSSSVRRANSRGREEGGQLVICPVSQLHPESYTHLTSPPPPWSSQPLVFNHESSHNNWGLIYFGTCVQLRA